MRRFLEFTRRPAAQVEATRAHYNGNVLCSKSLSSAGRMMPERILCYVMIIQWVVVYQVEQNDHSRDQRACAPFISAMPILLLGRVFACYGPSAFTLQWLNRTQEIYYDNS